LLDLGLKSNLLHIEAQLFGYFGEHFLGKVATLVAIKEPNKLNDVTSCIVSVTIKQLAVIAIKLFHVTEIGISNADDDD
jgi:hypothetical protein